MNLRYVFSAPGYCRLIPVGIKDNKQGMFPLALPLIRAGIDFLQEDISRRIPGYSFSLDLLFNAYKEKMFLDPILEYDMFGFKELYADSGGLQMAIYGLDVDAAAKEGIYEVQSRATYGMCFDEIPSKQIEGVQSTHRARTDDKMFYPEIKAESAKKTALNIKEQVEYFDKVNSKTKVHYIIQGNTVDDMVEWFEEGLNILEDAHFDRMAGVSIADTCIGNGSLESIDMLGAYHLLSTRYPERVKKHLHLLGIGSVSRLIPLIYMAQGGLIPIDNTYSFDSSTYSMGFVTGNFRDSNDKIIRDQKLHLKSKLIETMDYFEEAFRGLGEYDRDEVIDYLLSKYESTSSVVNESPDHLYPWVRAIIPLTNCYSIIAFVDKVAGVLEEMEYDNTPIGLLKNLRDIDDFKRWRSEYSRFVSSKRIERKRINSVMNFFGDST